MPRAPYILTPALALLRTAVFLFGLISAEAGEPVLKAPPGFSVTRAAGEPQIQFPMFATFDQHGGLFVAESSGLDLYDELQKQTRRCRISRLEDHNGDGAFEQARVFADQLVFPMGLAWREGKLYVADPPDLVTLEDIDGDGRSDRRTVILTGFGHRDNGSLHGLIFGPDGWLYLTMGEPDGYKLKRRDGSMLEGVSGALLRCRPDGADVEVVSRGFENLVEIAFLPTGDIIGTDNWFQQPSGGIRDALVHLVEGGLYPYAPEKGTPQPVTGEPLPALALYPAVALSGLVRYEGNAFPDAMRGSLFSAQFNARKIVRHCLAREGSTFRSDDEDFVTTDDPDFHPSDVLESADGSLLVLDTGSWYIHHCPTGRIRNAPARGGIYRVRFDEAKRQSDPWGLKLEWVAASTEQLLERIADPRTAVRNKAFQELIRRGQSAVALLARTLEDKTTASSVREQAIWILAGIPGNSALESLRRLLETEGNILTRPEVGKTSKSPASLPSAVPAQRGQNVLPLLGGEGSPPSAVPLRRTGGEGEQKSQSPQSDLVALAARALGRRADKGAERQLIPLLQHGAAHVRLAAAEALAHCGGPAAIGPLREALRQSVDRFLEHALVHALYRLATEQDLLTALEHPHPRVQQAALLLLDQPPYLKLPPDAALRRLLVPEEGLRRAARWVLRRHPDWFAPAVRAVRERASLPTLADWEEATLRELLADFQSHPDMQTFIAETVGATDSSIPERLRLLAIDSMARSDTVEVPAAWKSALLAALEHPSPAVQRQAVRAVQALKFAGVEDRLAVLARDERRPEPLRAEALHALVRRRAALPAADFRFLLGLLQPRQDPAVRLAAGEILRLTKLDGAQISAVISAVQTDTLIAPTVVLAAAKRGELTPRAAQSLVDYLDARFEHGTQFGPGDLEWLLANVSEPSRTKAAELRQRLATRQGEALSQLEEFQILLQGGDAERGRTLYSGKAACSACHQVGRQGGLVGPDLTRVGAIRSGRDLLESILLPSATFAQGYDTYHVVTTDGDELTGVRVEQADETFVLRDAGGLDHRLTAGRIKTFERLNLSVMPEGLVSNLTREEVRDLFAYLQELK